MLEIKNAAVVVIFIFIRNRARNLRTPLTASLF